MSPAAHAESLRPRARTASGTFRISGDLQDGGASAQALDVADVAAGPGRKEALDVTAVLVFFLVAVGLFIVPLGATLMQNEAVAAVVSSIE